MKKWNELDKSEKRAFAIGGPIIVICVIFVLVLIGSSGGFRCSGNNKSGYSLYNDDGSINWDYYNDMQDYFEKHPEKNPAGK